MAKQNEKSLKDAQDSFNQLMVTGQAPCSFDEAFEMLDKADMSALVDLSQEYYKFENMQEGEAVSFVCTGFGEFVKDEKVVPIVQLTDKEGRNFINGDKMLYSQCKRLSQLPAWIKVIYEGTQKNASGTYKKLRVVTFNIGS